jgi:threonine dehydratase
VAAAPIVTLADIEAARARIHGRVRASPCTYSRSLSELLDKQVYLKLENLQLTGSFKERGACNRLLQLDAEERLRGVVAASAGNHAQGVAYHARALGVPATIVMPRRSPLVKVTQTRSLGAEVTLVTGGYDEAFVEAERIAATTGRVLIPGFDDPAVIAGQGTIGLEILEQVPDVDEVVVAIGGGGLIAGVATALKESSLRPRPGEAAGPRLAGPGSSSVPTRGIHVCGVQSEAMPSMRAARQAGAPRRIEGVRTIADGIAVGQVGALPFAIAERYVDSIVTVDDEEIAEAILILLEREKLVAEGAGAAPLAALIHRELPADRKTIVLVIGGGNIDVNLLSRIIDRGLIKSGRIARLRVMVPDVPGSLARILAIVAESEANILAIEHDRVGTRLEFGQASVEITAETRGFEHVAAIVATLHAAGLFTRAPTD